MLQIKTVTYRKLRTLPHGYHNVAVEATAEVEITGGPPDEDAPRTLDQLRTWVEAQVIDKTIEEMQSARDEMNWEVGALQRQKSSLTLDVERLRREISELNKQTGEFKLQEPGQ